MLPAVAGNRNHIAIQNMTVKRHGLNTPSAAAALVSELNPIPISPEVAIHGVTLPSPRGYRDQFPDHPSGA